MLALMLVSFGMSVDEAIREYHYIWRLRESQNLRTRLENIARKKGLDIDLPLVQSQACKG
jgi:hypothetical protein